LEAGQQLVAADMAGPTGLQGFLLRRESGRIEEVRPLVRHDEPVPERWAPGLLALYCELGLDAPTRRVLGWLTDHLDEYARSGTWAATIAFLSEAVVRLEDEESARLLRPMLRELSGYHLAVGPLSAVFGSATRYLGSIEALLGQADADDVLARGIEEDRAMDASLFVGYGLAARAGHLRRVGGAASTVDALRTEAMNIAERCGLPRLRNSLGVRAARYPDGLTAREVDVLRLLGQGLSNRDVAQRLFISENTATNHVRSILMKTRSSNRTQAARYAARQGLL
jgi:DNA-binding CsgD family transcriptional regulator